MDPDPFGSKSIDEYSSPDLDTAVNILKYNEFFYKSKKKANLKIYKTVGIIPDPHFKKSNTQFFGASCPDQIFSPRVLVQ